MKSDKKSGGFTLIEIVVVILLITLMLFIAIPRLQGTLLSDSTKKVSRWIIFKVRLLKEKAFQDQKGYVLHVNLDLNKMWTSDESMSEDELQNAFKNAFQLPRDIKLLDVEYPGDEKVTAGQADISFYEKGYSDMAMIHIENDDNEKLSFVIEPFLLRVKLLQKYMGFEN